LAVSSLVLTLSSRESAPLMESRMSCAEGMFSPEF
jgi:hypothetical protein